MASSRDLVQVLIFNSQRAGGSLQAPANSFFVINSFNCLSKLLQPTAACRSGSGSLAGGEPNTGSCLCVDGAARNCSLVDVGQAEEEGEEDEHREEAVLHGV